MTVNLLQVVVWDGGSGSEKNATADFIRGVAHSVPPTLDILKDIGGVDIPEYIGSLRDQDKTAKKLPQESTKLIE